MLFCSHSTINTNVHFKSTTNKPRPVQKIKEDIFDIEERKERERKQKLAEKQKELSSTEKQLQTSKSLTKSTAKSTTKTEKRNGKIEKMFSSKTIKRERVDLFDEDEKEQERAREKEREKETALKKANKEQIKREKKRIKKEGILSHALPFLNYFHHHLFFLT